LTTAAAFASAGFAGANGSAALTAGAGGASFSGAGYAGARGSASLTAKASFVGAGTAPAAGALTLTVPSLFTPGNEAVWLVPARDIVSLVTYRVIVAQASTD
jgi:hypothetical protein